MKRYKSRLNIKISDYYGKIALWMIAIVCTLGFAAIPFQLWLAKVILDNWEVHETVSHGGEGGFNNQSSVSQVEVKMADQEKFIKCSCHSEGMLLTKFDGEEEIYVSFWREGINPVKLTWWMRLKLCWMALTKGNYYDDQIILNRQKSVELACWIISDAVLTDVLDEKDKKKDENNTKPWITLY